MLLWAHRQHRAGGLGAAEGRVGLDPSVSKARVGRVGDRAGNAAGEDGSHRGVFRRGDHRTRSALGRQNPPPPGCGRGCGGRRGRRWAAISGHLDTRDFKALSRIDSRFPCLLPAPFPDALCHLRRGLTFSHFLCVAGLSKIGFPSLSLRRDQSRLGSDYFIYLVFPTHFLPTCSGINGSLASL